MSGPVATLPSQPERGKLQAWLRALPGRLAAALQVAPLVPRYVLVAPAGIVVPAAALLLFAFVPQVADMALGLYGNDGDSDGPLWTSITLLLTTLFLGFTGWAWTSAVLQVEMRRDLARRLEHPAPTQPNAAPSPDVQAMRWAARLPLLLAAGAAAVPLLLRPAEHRGLALILLAGLSLAEWWLTRWRRRSLDRQFARHDGHLSPSWLRRLLAPQVTSPTPAVWYRPWAALLGLPRYLLAVLAAGPLGLWLALFQVVSAVVLVLYGSERLVTQLGISKALLAALTALMLLIPLLAILIGVLRRLPALALAALLLSLLYAWTDGVPVTQSWPPLVVIVAACVAGLAIVFLGAWLRGRGAPQAPPPCLPGRPGFQLLAPLAALIMMVALPVPGAMYQLRQPAETDSSAWKRPRPTLTQALKAWADACKHPQDGDVPVVIVALAGGASRSAVWSLAAMRYLDARTEGRFGGAVFAISAVSGGSLGAATYRELARRPGLGCDSADRWKDERAVELLARQDFLAPSVASYFLSDTVRRTLGSLPDFVWDGTPGRSVAIEQAFERFWAEQRGAGEDPPWFLAPDAPKAPHLLLNGTDVRLGRRIITSTLSFYDAERSRRREEAIFSNADDLLPILCGDLPLSTAVMNSARFPYISPVGHFQDPGSRCPEGKPTQRQIADGGYFENNGAATALELARAIGEVRGARQYRPMVVVITNDAEMTDDQLQQHMPHCGQSPELPEKALADAIRVNASSTVGQAFAPLALLGNLRSAHNRAALIDLRRELCDAGDDPVMEAKPMQPPETATPGSSQDGPYRSADTCGAGTAPLSRHRLFHVALRKPLEAAGSRKAEGAPMNWVLDEPARALLLDGGGGLATCFNERQAVGLAAALDLSRLPRAATGYSAN